MVWELRWCWSRTSILRVQRRCRKWRIFVVSGKRRKRGITRLQRELEDWNDGTGRRGEKVHLKEGAGRTSRNDGAEASRSSSWVNFQITIGRRYGSFLTWKWDILKGSCRAILISRSKVAARGEFPCADMIQWDLKGIMQVRLTQTLERGGGKYDLNRLTKTHGWWDELCLLGR